MDTIQSIRNEIIRDPKNKTYTDRGWHPIFRAYPEAQILIIGQAPGLKTQLRDDVFRDQSGDRLRNWLGVTESQFYDSRAFAVLPMDFYFPGKGKTGDLPPRSDFANQWHPRLIACMPNIQLIILIGHYAQKHYLGPRMKRNLTETVHAFRDYLPPYFPIVHPSPLNRRWLAKNSFFEQEVVPELKHRTKEILA